MNLAMSLHESGVLERYGVELIGAKYDAIRTAEDRQLFKDTMERIGVEVPRSGHIGTLVACHGMLRLVTLRAGKSCAEANQT